MTCPRPRTELPSVPRPGRSSRPSPAQFLPTQRRAIRPIGRLRPALASIFRPRLTRPPEQGCRYSSRSAQAAPFQRLPRKPWTAAGTVVFFSRCRIMPDRFPIETWCLLRQLLCGGRGSISTGPDRDRAACARSLFPPILSSVRNAGSIRPRQRITVRSRRGQKPIRRRPPDRRRRQPWLSSVPPPFRPHIPTAPPVSALNLPRCWRICRAKTLAWLKSTTAFWSWGSTACFWVRSARPLHGATRSTSGFGNCWPMSLRSVDWRIIWTARCLRMPRSRQRRCLLPTQARWSRHWRGQRP